MAIGATKVIQVTNIAPQATKDQMHVLFGYLGKIDDIRLYPTVRDVSIPVQSRICYIKFNDPITSGIAQHMTNTVFIDRALIVLPVQNGEIPDEYYALEMTKNGTVVPGLNVHEPKLPSHVVNSVQGSGADQVIITIDSTLDQNDLPGYPPLPSTYDSCEVEETRRTILVQNVDPAITYDQWINYFSKAGEVKYLRTCTRIADGSDNLLVEFTEQPSVVNALKLDGQTYKGLVLQIQHATQPIEKPQTKSNEAAQKEIEEAMSRFKEAQNQINATIEPVIGMLTKDKKGSRRSSRSRSRSRGRRRRSRSTSRRRSRSRRRRSTSRKRSRSRDKRKRSRSRRRSVSKRRSVSREKVRRSRSRSKKRSKSKDRKSSRARSREKKSPDKPKERKRSRDRSKDRKSLNDSKVKEKSLERKSESVDLERKRSKSRSRSRRRSKSRDRKREKRRSRSRVSRRRSPTPPRKRRSRSRSKDRESKRKDKKEKKRSRSRSRDRKERRAKSKGRSRSKSRSKSKLRSRDSEMLSERPSDRSRSKSRSKSKLRSKDSEMFSERPPEPADINDNDKDSGGKSDNNMDISNSP